MLITEFYKRIRECLKSILEYETQAIAFNIKNVISLGNVNEEPDLININVFVESRVDNSRENLTITATTKGELIAVTRLCYWDEIIFQYKQERGDNLWVIRGYRKLEKITSIDVTPNYLHLNYTTTDGIERISLHDNCSIPVVVGGKNTLEKLDKLNKDLKL